MTASAMLAGGIAPEPANAASLALLGPLPNLQLRFKTTPVDKRTSVTVFDAKQSGYNVRFVTYFSRFLLNFDNDCQCWWHN